MLGYVQLTILSNPATTPPADEPELRDDVPVNSAVEVLSDVFDALGSNGYQTGAALIVTTIAIVALVNVGTHRLVTAVVAIGAFWAGWLGYNTLTDSDNELFPSDVSATKLWDIAFTSDANFLLVTVVACVAAIFLWRSSIKIYSRLILMLGAVLGASIIYNIYEALQASS